MVYSQAELHALWLVIDIEGDLSSSSPLPVLPKEPVSFHSNTTVIGFIPPRLPGANSIISLQMCARLQGYDPVGIMEMWWDGFYDWRAGMEGYRLFRKDRQGR